ncbi:MAG: DoxX family membrane protein, partial [Candidatus Eremiobacteraeota bacterium]|nr:DoxX family membrane protein [Candidatus Eremiobacteraeota bacterium]
MKSLPSSSAYAGWLALLRILTGAAWLAHAIPKYSKSDEFMPPNGFIVSFVSRGLENTTGAYHNFLAGAVQPNLALFAELVRLGELLTGAVLVLGLFTRLGGLVGIFLTLNYMAAKGIIFRADALESADFSMFLLSAINFVLPTGRV